MSGKRSTERDRDRLSVDIGGRSVVTFATVEEDGELVSIYPIPIDAVQGFAFSGAVEEPTAVDVYGVQNAIGRRIAAKYDSGELPAEEVSWEMITDE